MTDEAGRSLRSSLIGMPTSVGDPIHDFKDYRSEYDPQALPSCVHRGGVRVRR
jgi:hypothetical protein